MSLILSTIFIQLLLRVGASIRRPLLAAALLVFGLVFHPLVLAKENPPSTASTATTIVVAQMPVQGREVYAQIKAGGPFKYDKDGVVFSNRERILPAQKRGYYREYTVPTPGAKNRGARRIVCGGQEPKQPKACYYSDDHYASFRQIVE